MEIGFILSALGLGIASGFHCIGMCGPIAMSMGIGRKASVNNYIQNILYQSGRIFTYCLLGTIFGILGEGLHLAGWQKYLSIFSGIFLVLLSIFSFKGKEISHICPLVDQFLPFIQRKLSKFLQKTGYSSRFIAGILNGFLPCGMVYIALTASLSAGSLIKSTLFMFYFGLGTVPFMFGMVMLGNVITASVRNKILKIIPIFTFVLGALLFLRGLGIGIPYTSPKTEVLDIQKRDDKEKIKKNSCH
ncbi:MAG: sulfite exporter TauE/SafE family protein [Bergeyella sp.]|nr:sulfite exporter TauE/SafE family protein [Bergeyella sp.]